MADRARMVPGIVFALIVIATALGNCTVGFYPYGTAVWLRPLVSLTGLLGAALLLAGSGWWRIVLPIWCLVQTSVIATDVSGEWFFQGLFIGWRHTTSVRNGNILTELETSGFNFAGPLLAAITVLIIALRTHPPIRWRVTRRQTMVVAICCALVLLPAIGVASWRKYQNASATFVLDLDLPSVPIYYQGQLLGRTPLAITPDKIKQWNLPLHDFDHLRLDSFGWADCEILSDGETTIPLYAGVPWAFADNLDTFDSPWGQRVRMHAGRENGNRREGFVYRKPALRDSPILNIQLLNPTPLHAADVLHIRCTLNNPTPRTYTGVRSGIERYYFSFNRRGGSSTTPPTTKPRREAELPATWSTLPPAGTFTTDLDFDGPRSPDAYELFCTWNLFKDADSDSLTIGSVYSNMLYIDVKP